MSLLLEHSLVCVCVEQAILDKPVSPPLDSMCVLCCVGVAIVDFLIVLCRTYYRLFSE